MAVPIKQKLRASGLSLAVLAVAAAPIGVSAATSSANTTINATVNSVISVATSGTVPFTLTPTAGGVVSSSSDTVTVSTNNNAGYTLTLKDTDATTTLVNGASNTIAAHAGTTATPTALANGTWGFAVGGLGTFDATYSAEASNPSSTSKWAGVAASGGAAATLKTTSTTATSDTTQVWYAAKVNTSQPNGVYSDTVTYTATTN